MPLRTTFVNPASTFISTYLVSKFSTYTNKFTISPATLEEIAYLAFQCIGENSADMLRKNLHYSLLERITEIDHTDLIHIELASPSHTKTQLKFTPLICEGIFNIIYPSQKAMQIEKLENLPRNFFSYSQLAWQKKTNGVKDVFILTTQSNMSLVMQQKNYLINFLNVEERKLLATSKLPAIKLNSTKLLNDLFLHSNRAPSFNAQIRFVFPNKENLKTYHQSQEITHLMTKIKKIIEGSTEKISATPQSLILFNSNAVTPLINTFNRQRVQLWYVKESEKK